MGWFRIPREVLFGIGAIENLKNITGEKAFIVTGKNSMKASGVLNKVQDYLREQNIDSFVFDGIEGDPLISTVYRGAEEMRDYQPDIIIGLGGCSAIDAAKTMWVFYENPDLKFQDIIDPFTIPQLRKKASYIAIPSTSGTGTEVTCVAVITDDETGIKYPLASYEITPDIAIVDPEICKTMPPNVTADTGMDALSHALEAYVSTIASEFTDALAIESIKIIFDWLPKAYEDGNNIEAREKMHNAQCLAGMSFSNAILGIIHSMSHKISTKVPTTHGRCNAILTPYVIRFNSEEPRASARYADIARAIGLQGNEEELISGLINAIEKLNTELDIPNNIKELGLSKETFMDIVQESAESSLKDPCTGFNPRKPSLADIISIYKEAFGV